MKSALTAHDVVYATKKGSQVCADSLDVLASLPKNSVDLVVTSPPFALLRKKEYGNEDQDGYVEWLARFGEAILPVLTDHGSLVIDLGGAYRRGVPVRSLYNYRVLLRFVDELGYHLAEEFFWFNPAKIPSPTEWVTKRKIRVTDAVNTIWWLSKTEFPRADVTQVLNPYSKTMKDLLKDPDKYYKPTQRPSEHEITKGFGKDNGGSIPKNLLRISNTASNSHYLRTIRMLGEKTHPARFPPEIPKFFIKYLTNPQSLVVDIFSGSNTTGEVAESLGRRWLSVEMHRPYAELSAVRFLEKRSEEEIRGVMSHLQARTTLDL